MPIIRDSTKKLSDINQSNQFMNSLYRGTDKVFSRYVKAGTILFNNGKPTALGVGSPFTRTGNVHDSHGNIIEYGVSYSGLPQSTISLPFSIDHIRNGIQIYATYFLVDPYGETDLDNLEVPGVDNSDEIDTQFPVSVSINELKSGVQYFNSHLNGESQSLTIRAKDNRTLESFSEIGTGTHFVNEHYATGDGSLPTFLLIDSITAY